MKDSGKFRPLQVFGGVALALGLGFGGGFLWKRPAASSPEQIAEPAASRSTETPTTKAPADANLRYQIPVSDTQPQRGPADALVTVVEWCDLRGAPCRAADKLMSELMAEYAGDLRWVHRHLIDRDHFAESHHAHAFARGAFQHPDVDDQEKFWLVREKLLALPDGAVLDDAALRRIAQEIGVDFEEIEKGVQSKAYAGGLSIDTAFASRFGVAAGPGFFVNGRPVRTAASPAETKAALKALVEQELASARTLVESGVAKSAVYDELTKDGLWVVNEDRGKRPARRLPAQSLSQSRPN